MDAIKSILICGYLRDIMQYENDYTDIMLIILSFCKQGFAKYFDENMDKDYKLQMRFGDILRTENDALMVLDINNEYQEIGLYQTYEPGYYNSHGMDVYIDMSIDLSICQHLDDAVLFYSKLQKEEVWDEADSTSIQLTVKHNDEWIIKHFDGALNPKYKSIKILLRDGEHFNVNICFDDKCFKNYFADNGRKVTCKDVDNDYNETKRIERHSII